MAAARRTSVSQTSVRDRRGGQAVSRTVAVTEQDVGEVAPKKHAGLPDAMVFATTVLLVLAIVVTDYWLGTQFGTGMFFK